MTEQKLETDSVAEGPVFCRRLERPLPFREHLDCPYCFGNKADISTAEHACFCDFEPGKDPIHFGFPEGLGG